jgi:hypothetical protein
MDYCTATSDTSKVEQSADKNFFGELDNSFWDADKFDKKDDDDDAADDASDDDDAADDAAEGDAAADDDDAAGGDAAAASDKKTTATLMQLIDAIKLSQDNEQALYKQLEENAIALAEGKAATLTDEERDKIVDSINKEAEFRRKLYKIVDEIVELHDASAEEAIYLTAEQLKLSKFLERTLNSIKEQLNATAEKRQIQLKMVEINTYYGKVYQFYASFARAVAIIAILLIIPTVFREDFPEFASNWTTIVMYGGGMYLLYLLYDMASRRSDNYEEYTFPFAPTTKLELTNPKKIIDISGVDVPTICAGQYCCGPGTTWDNTLGCVIQDDTDINA